MAFCALQIILFRVVLFLLSVFALDVAAVRNYNVYKKYYAREICSSNGVPEYHLQETGLYSAARFSTSPNWKYYDKICTFRIIPPVGYGVILNVDFYLQINIINRSKSYIEVAEDKEITRESIPKDFFKKQFFITTGNMTVSYHIDNISSTSLIISTLRDKNLVFHDEQYMPSYGFAITATAYQTRFQRCKGSQFECSLKRCIWSGFTCDRVNNCGDHRDEKDYGSSDCDYTREICNSSGVPEYHLQETGLFSAARFATSPNWVYHDGVCTFKIVPPVSCGVILNVDYYFIPNPFNECGSYIEISEDDEITKICGPKIFFKKTTFVTRRNMTVAYHINKVDSDSIINSLFGDKNRVFHDEVYIPLDGFVLTATAYQTGVERCKGDQFECSLGRCIWNGLTCDIVNNCGDNKDEREYDYSDCDYVREICNSGGVPEYHLQDTGILSAARFATSLNWTYIDRVCTCKIVPPVGYGVIQNLDYYFIGNPSNLCASYIEIVEDAKTTKLCSPRRFQKKSFRSKRNMTLSFHISEMDSCYLVNSPLDDKNHLFDEEEYKPLRGFVLTATAYQMRNGMCRGNQFKCWHGSCIWNGFTCDKVNNCGEKSDERDYDSSHCGDVQNTTSSPKIRREFHFSSSENFNYNYGLVGAIALFGIIFLVCRHEIFEARSGREFSSNIDVVPSTTPTQQPPFQQSSPNQRVEPPSEEISPGNTIDLELYWETIDLELYREAMSPTAPKENLDMVQSQSTSTNLSPSVPPTPYGKYLTGNFIPFERL